MLTPQADTKLMPSPAIRCWLAAIALAGGLCQVASADLSDFAVFADDGVTLGDNVTILGGPVGNNAPSGGVYAGSGLTAPDGVLGGGTFFEAGGASTGRIVMGGPFVGLGNGSVVAGNLDAGGDVFLGVGSLVTGDLTAPGLVLLDPGASVAGVTTIGPSATVSPVAMPSTGPLPVGTTNVATSAGDLVRTLMPGAFGDISLVNGSTLNLSAGSYVFNSLTAGNGLVLAMDLTGGGVSIFIESNVAIGNDAAMTTIGSGSAYAYTNADWAIGNSGNWTGTIYAPTGALSAGSDFSITGNLHAHSVNIGSDSTVTGTPIDSPPPVPAPPAILLGAIGLGMIARKRAYRKS